MRYLLALIGCLALAACAAPNAATKTAPTPSASTASATCPVPPAPEFTFSHETAPAVVDRSRGYKALTGMGTTTTSAGVPLIILARIDGKVTGKIAMTLDATTLPTGQTCTWMIHANIDFAWTNTTYYASEMEPGSCPDKMMHGYLAGNIADEARYETSLEGTSRKTVSVSAQQAVVDTTFQGARDKLSAKVLADFQAMLTAETSRFSAEMEEKNRVDVMKPMLDKCGAAATQRFAAL